MSLTNHDATTDTKADGHTDARGLMTALPCGSHFFKIPLKVKGVNQPLIEKEKQKKKRKH